MADLPSLYDQHKDLPPEEQKKIGQAVPGQMGDAYTVFVKSIAQMITSGEINVFQPTTFYRDGAYAALSEDDRSQVDLATVNIADLLRHIADFYISKQTPDSSPQLQQMIDELWQMKERLEKKFGKLFKF